MQAVRTAVIHHEPWEGFVDLGKPVQPNELLDSTSKSRPEALALDLDVEMPSSSIFTVNSCSHEKNPVKSSDTGTFIFYSSFIPGFSSKSSIGGISANVLEVWSSLWDSATLQVGLCACVQTLASTNVTPPPDFSAMVFLLLGARRCFDLDLLKQRVFLF